MINASSLLSPRPYQAPPISAGPVMISIIGCKLSEIEEKHIGHPNTGGVILFKRNFENRVQLCALIQEIRAVRRAAGNGHIIIAVDQEGGRVQRFKGDGFTDLPAMSKLGDLYEIDQKRAKDAAKAIGFVMAAELRACDLDLSFAPVLDLNYGHNTVIGDRAFHCNPDVVAELAEDLIKGMQEAGIANCGKHFPGHGYVEKDSHYEVPEDNRPLKKIKDEDMKPYRKLSDLLTAVMPAFVRYTGPDDTNHDSNDSSDIAAFSTKWNNTLRKDVGFKGAKFSDALNMKGASPNGESVTQAALKAFQAGCDMVLIDHTKKIIGQLLEELEKLEHKPNQASLDRLSKCLAQDEAFDWDKLQKEALYQSSKALIATEFFPDKAAEKIAPQSFQIAA